MTTGSNLKKMRTAWWSAGLFVLVLLPGAAQGEHFPVPSDPPSSSCEYLGGITIDTVPAEPGDEVAFVDQEGDILGTTTITTPGQYGMVAVYGVSQSLAVRVWDASAAKEYQEGCLVLSSGTVDTEFVSPAQIPPVCEDNHGYALNIETGPLAGDLNNDCRLDLHDVLVGLRIVGTTDNTASDLPDGADLNNDQRVGLAEVIFILQKSAGLRN